MRKYRWHFEFTVGGPVRGYKSTVEAVSHCRTGAAQKIRNRIKVMNVEIKFHASQIVRGKPILESEGHDDVELYKATYPKPLRDGRKHPTVKDTVPQSTKRKRVTR